MPPAHESGPPPRSDWPRRFASHLYRGEVILWTGEADAACVRRLRHRGPLRSLPYLTGAMLLLFPFVMLEGRPAGTAPWDSPDALRSLSPVAFLVACFASMLLACSSASLLPTLQSGYAVTDRRVLRIDQGEGGAVLLEVRLRDIKEIRVTPLNGDCAHLKIVAPASWPLPLDLHALPDAQAVLDLIDRERERSTVTPTSPHYNFTR